MGLIPQKNLSEVAEKFQIDPKTLIPLQGGHTNIVFQGASLPNLPNQNPIPDRILKIYKSDASPSSASFLSMCHWMKYLKKSGMGLPEVLISTKGNLVEQLRISGINYTVICFDKITGTLAQEMQSNLLNPIFFAQLGKAIGFLHTLSRSYQKEPDYISRLTWEEDDNYFRLRNEKTRELQPFIVRQKELVEKMNTFSRDMTNFGLIHGDLHLENILVNPETFEVSFLDFENSIYGWYLMDLAFILLDFSIVFGRTDKIEFARAFLPPFFEEYSRFCPLDNQKFAQLEILIATLEIGLYVDLYPEYVQNYQDPQFSREDNESNSFNWIQSFMENRQARIQQKIPIFDQPLKNFLD